MKDNHIKQNLRQLAESETPSNFDLWPRVKDEIQRQSNRRQNRRRLVLGVGTFAAGVLALLLVLILNFSAPRLLSESQNPTSQLILFSTPTTAPITPARNGHVHSYRGVIQGLDRPTTGITTPSPWQSAVWGAGPDKLRVENFAGCTQLPQTPTPTRSVDVKSIGALAIFGGPDFLRCPLPESIILLDGSTRLHVDVGATDITVKYLKANEYEHNLLWDHIADNPVNIMWALKSVGEEVLIPNDTIENYAMGFKFLKARFVETKLYDQIEAMDNPDDAQTGTLSNLIAGRPTYRIKLTLNNLYVAQNDEQIRWLWIDQETFIPLASQSFDKAGHELSSWAFTSFELNPNLDPGIFAYLPPSTLHVKFVGINDYWLHIAPESGLSISPFDLTLDVNSQFALSTRLMPLHPVYDAEKHIFIQKFLPRRDPTKITPILTVIGGSPDAINQIGSEIAGTPITDNTSRILYFEHQDKRLLILNDLSPHKTEKLALIGEGEISKDDLLAITHTFTAVDIHPTEIPISVASGKVAIPIPQSRITNPPSIIKIGDEVDLAITFEFAATKPSAALITLTPISIMELGANAETPMHIATMTSGLQVTPQITHLRGTIIRISQVSDTTSGTANVPVDKIITLAMLPQDAVNLKYAIDSLLPISVTVIGSGK